MNRLKKKQIDKLDQKISSLARFSARPPEGWIGALRLAFNMTRQQLASKLGIKPQSVMDMEFSESNGNISIKTLQRVGLALNLNFVYGFLPNDGTFEKLIENQALITARKIVMRTNATMKLEDQQINEEELKKAVKELATEIKNEMPRYLWD